MNIIKSEKKQKGLIAKQYQASLHTGPRPENLSPNVHNLLDDDNAADTRLIKETRRYMAVYYKHTA